MKGKERYPSFIFAVHLHEKGVRQQNSPAMITGTAAILDERLE
jgi:hypothetical protein